MPLECQLSGVVDRPWFGIEQPIERFAVHQIGAHQAGKAQRTGDGLLPGLGQAQQQKGDQRDGVWILTAFSLVPRKPVMRSTCLTQRKNNSIAQRRL